MNDYVQYKLQSYRRQLALITPNSRIFQDGLILAGMY